MKPRVLVFTVTVALATWALVLWQFHNTSLTAQKLCTVLYERIAISDHNIGRPGFTGYQYYRDHPGELAAAHKATRETLDALPCSPGGGR